MLRSAILLAALFVPSLAFGQLSARMAVCHDGNFYDKDDWGSAAMNCALLDSLGLRPVYFEINNHFPQSSAQWQKAMRLSTAEGPYFQTVYDCRQDTTGARSALRAQINASGPSNRLTVLLGGPAETLWQALQGVPLATRQCVDVVSHSSPYNETSGPHTLAQCSGVRVIKIPNQNARLNTKQNAQPWARLKNSADSYDRWVYSRMQSSGRFDVSDSGMLIYVATGNANATPATLCGILLAN